MQQDNPNALLRIDIVPEEVEICNLDKIDKLFGWPGNDCLSASVKSVLQDMFAMIMLVEIDNSSLGFEELRESLNKVGENTNTKIHIMHEDIFNSMHKI